MGLVFVTAFCVYCVPGHGKAPSLENDYSEFYPDYALEVLSLLETVSEMMQICHSREYPDGHECGNPDIIPACAF